MVIGDFNAVLGSHEGGLEPYRVSCTEFQAMSDSCNLIHIDTRGHPFTWNNAWRSRGYIQLRLDRSLCHPSWFDNWPDTISCTLPRVASDHNPLLLTANKLAFSGPLPFRFKSMWIQHPDFYLRFLHFGILTRSMAVLSLFLAVLSLFESLKGSKLSLP